MQKKIPSGTLHKAGEDYLEAILRLEMEKGNVRSIDVANLLEFTKPSVSRAVSVLSEAGYLRVDEDHSLHLTPRGREIATEIYERHCVITEFLVGIGVDPKTAEEDACQIEHVISRTSFEKLRELVEKKTFPL